VGPARPDGRRERSRRTHERIVEAASRCFVADGYVGATVDAIAEAAGVAPQTVYYVFGTKAKLLAAALERTIVGDLDPVPVVERPWVDELGEAHDAATAVGLLVDESVKILVRVAPLHRVIQRAAADTEVGPLLEETRRRRRADQARLVGILAERGHLRADLDAATAADIYYGLLNEEVFELLTTDCGWDVERFRLWATQLVQQQLVGPDPRGAVGH
jgi:AcrR family transcriptional regulator